MQSYQCIYNCTISCFADVAPPKFLSCPRTIEATAAKEELTAKVEWARPNVTDNSGIPPNVTIKGKKSGSFLNEGEHSVIYTAADNMGNFASCFVTIFVSGSLFEFLNIVLVFFSATEEVGNHLIIPRCGLFGASLMNFMSK